MERPLYSEIDEGEISGLRYQLMFCVFLKRTRVTAFLWDTEQDFWRASRKDRDVTEDRDGSTGDIYITDWNDFLSNNLLIRKSSAVWVRGVREGLRRDSPQFGVDCVGWPGSARDWWGGVSHLTDFFQALPLNHRSTWKYVCMSRKWFCLKLVDTIW